LKDIAGSFSLQKYLHSPMGWGGFLMTKPPQIFGNFCPKILGQTRKGIFDIRFCRSWKSWKTFDSNFGGGRGGPALGAVQILKMFLNFVFL
jgi:hypothetical protein